MGDNQPPAGTASLQVDELPPVVAALDARQRAWVRGAIHFLDANGIELVTGDFACGGFPDGRPRSTMLGALLLYNHRGWLPTDRAQQRYLAGRGWGWARSWRGGSGSTRPRICAPGTRSLALAGKAAVLRLLDAADAAAADGFA